MPTTYAAPADRDAPRIPAIQRRGGEVRAFLRRAAAFVGIGLVLYLGLYAAAERLARDNALRNRFFVVNTAPRESYDFVVLGASHAAVLDYRDMNARLEEMTGRSVLNLATVGGGVLPNRLLLDYFFAEHDAGAVVYVLDSFAFYSSDWNEDRLDDTALFARAPWDPTLARLLLREPAARKAALGYISGFSKINDRDRFEPDLFAAETSAFDRAYRPIAQIDRQRMEYLYPAELNETTLLASPYLAQFEELVRDVRARGARFIVVRPPIPERIRRTIPFEAHFDQTIRALVARNGAELHDFSRVNDDPELFHDSDHLNQAGVLRFFENHFRYVLTGAGPGAR